MSIHCMLTDGLKRRAFHRLSFAYRPGTIRNRQSHVSKFHRFCTLNSIARAQQFKISPVQAICFLEYLTNTLNSYQSVLNVLASIKYYFHSKGKNTKVFDSFIVKNMLRALKMTLQPPSTKVVISAKQYKTLIKAAARYGPDRHVIRLAFTLGFCGLLSRANIAPEFATTFDSDRHTTLQDICIKHNHVIISVLCNNTRACL